MACKEFLPPPKNFSTDCIHYAQEPEQWESMNVVTPLVLSSTYKYLSPGELKYYCYGRLDNPTRNVLERVIAKLEVGKYCLCYASGLAAIMTVLAMFGTGDHIVCGDDIYGGTNAIFGELAPTFGIEVDFVDTVNLENVKAAIRPNTRMVYIETPSNPTLKCTDIAALSKITKENKCILCVDNTFLTCFFQRPLNFGADVVVYSLTKYMNGHTDVIMGAVITSDDDIYKKLKFRQIIMGAVPSPFDCAAILRSLKTLSLRMMRHYRSGVEVARFLESHKNVIKVIHPSLPSHPQHELQKRQTSGHSGMIAVYIKGTTKNVNKFLDYLHYFTLAVSLGGYESLIEIPATMTHKNVPQEQLDKLKITENLLRISVGLEDPEDLIGDLKHALDSYLN